MRQALGSGALGRPRGIGWRGRWEGGSGWGTHVNPVSFQCMTKFTTIKIIIIIKNKVMFSGPNNSSLNYQPVV